jgi:hypothetical protein
MEALLCCMVIEAAIEATVTVSSSAKTAAALIIMDIDIPEILLK